LADKDTSGPLSGQLGVPRAFLYLARFVAHPSPTVELHRIRIVLTLAAFLAAGPAFSQRPSSLCTAGEDVVFACRTGTKLASVCASKDASRTAGSLQYRFGPAAQPPEIVLPPAPTLPAKSAVGENVAFSGGGGSWIRFRKGEYGYVAYSGIGRWGPNGQTRTKQGIVVERAGKPIARLECGETHTVLPGADWFDKLGVRTNGEDFDFPD
jgi:hypothetical protein